jgi:hypothetical protein
MGSWQWAVGGWQKQLALAVGIGKADGGWQKQLAVGRSSWHWQFASARQMAVGRSRWRLVVGSSQWVVGSSQLAVGKFPITKPNSIFKPHYCFFSSVFFSIANCLLSIAT